VQRLTIGGNALESRGSRAARSVLMHPVSQERPSPPELAMSLARLVAAPSSRSFRLPRAAAGLLAAALGLATFAPGTAQAEESGRVASIAAKGTVPPLVPVVGGLGLGLASAVLALGMEKRSRR
jgi:hypothetical protein